MTSIRGRSALAGALALALVGLVLGVVSPAPVYADNPACQPNAILVNPCRPWLGASANGYPQVTATLQPQTLYHEQRIGRQLDIVHAYNGPGVDLTADESFFATRQDTMLYLNWRPTLTWADADGSDDATNASIDAMAESIQALGSTKIFLALYHEPEKDVSGTPAGCTAAGTGTAGTTDDYRAMWRNVRARFDALGVTNVVWVMNYMSYAPYRCMDADLWPGNDLVDWVAFDNYGSGAQPNFVTNVGSMYDFLNSTSDADHDYAAKPYALAEWGIRGANVTPQQTYDYSDEAKAAVEGDVFPNIRAYLVFDNKGSDGNENRVSYQNGGVYDPVRQQHYTAFADSSAFVDPPPDTTAPSVPSGLSAMLTGSSVDLSWQPSSDDVGVSGYNVLRNGVLLGQTAGTSYPDTTGQQGSTYSYTVQAYDAAGNVSASSDALSETVPDVTPPDTPAQPAVKLTSTKSITVTWKAVTDNVGVSGYQVWRNGALVTTVTGLTYTDSSVKQGGSYSYQVSAVDAAGNVSTASPASRTLSIADTTKPSTPLNLKGTSTTARTVTLTWSASSDNVGVTGYYVFRSGTRLATVSGGKLTYGATGLTSGKSYTFTVQAFDAAGNVSSKSAGLTIKAK